jgi:hypothetical protein
MCSPARVRRDIPVKNLTHGLLCEVTRLKSARTNFRMEKDLFC